MVYDLSISICVPALNEEKSLRASVGDLWETLSGSVRELEIIIVDDGSIDETPRLAEQLINEIPRLKFVRHSRNMGIGVCYRDALAIAEGDYFTWFPADHENSAKEFIQCLPYLKKNVIVTSHHRGHDPRSSLRRRTSVMYTFILNNFFRLNLKYYNGSTIFPTLLLRSAPLVAKGFVFTAESLIRIVLRGYKVVELSAPLSSRACGKSKAFTVRSFCRILEDILRIIRFEIKNKRIYLFTKDKFIL